MKGVARNSVAVIAGTKDRTELAQLIRYPLDAAVEQNVGCVALLLYPVCISRGLGADAAIADDQIGVTPQNRVGGRSRVGTGKIADGRKPGEFRRQQRSLSPAEWQRPTDKFIRHQRINE